MELAWNAQKNQITDVKGKENEQERKGEIKNDDIDLERTKNNYDLVESEKNLYQRVKQRVDELKENGSRVQKNSVVMYSNILTVPQEQAEKWGEQKTDDYFKACYEFFCKEFGKENVVSGKIHKDETTPHMHLHFVPVNIENGKLQARVAMNKAKINYIHDALPKFLQERGFDVVRASGKTKENNIENIHEFKEIKKRISEQEQQLDFLEKRVKNKQALSEVIPNDELQVKAKKEMKIEVVKTGLFSKEEKKVETGNVVISREDYKKMKQVATAALQIKANYERLLSTDLVRENNKLRESELLLFNQRNTAHNQRAQLQHENKELKSEITSLNAHISDLRAEIRNLYKITKEFIKERTSNAMAFKDAFKSLIDKVKQKAPGGEFERLDKREKARERDKGMER
ncbi:recombinase [Salmonella enterica subsp. enterica serovar Enteritidis]|uniref:MobV family relaxase n=1 Tax=Lysinibacillus sphaericus TaxID=1421 RepID=UPI001CBFA070|nr:MobV family relaxase [Lysinibacillus sphaericus]EDW5948325.1 recombinase [Salmonella enterica subsp. enterica serovar Enteritidis]